MKCFSVRIKENLSGVWFMYLKRGIDEIYDVERLLLILMDIVCYMK